MVFEKMFTTHTSYIRQKSITQNVIDFFSFPM